MTISLVYLCRGKGAGLGAAERFIDHYCEYDPGCEHDLVVVFKGWDKAQAQVKQELMLRFQSLAAKVVELDDDGFDWGAYMRVSVILQTDFICFLNSFSRPLGHLWLKYMYQSIKVKDVGICGATAAYKAWRFSWPPFELRFLPAIMYPLRVIRRLVNNCLLFGSYPSEYCPHLRSNGFAVERDSFLNFASSNAIPQSKRDCYRLESGVGSYSNYVLSLNQKLVLVDKFGTYYDTDDWIRSNTYCCPGQPGLCIADNNTDSYDKQDISGKRRMEFDVWGSFLHE
jgi:hypothetical protein